MDAGTAASTLVAAVMFLAGCAATSDAPPAAATPDNRRNAAMVQVVENWALVEGQVEAWQPASSGTRAVLTLRVDRVTSVERSAGAMYPNFLEGREGASVRVVLPEDPGAPLPAGTYARVRVRRGQQPDQFFAHPDGVTPLTR